MGSYHCLPESFYFLDDLNAPMKTINNPNAIPISIPILILRMANPNNNPKTIAKIKATSPLLVSGFDVFISLLCHAGLDPASKNLLRKIPA